MIHSHFDLGEVTPAGASASSFGAKLAIGLDQYSQLSVHITSTGLAGGTLNIGLWTTFDNGTSWYELFRSLDITAAAAASTITVSPWLGNGATAARGRVLGAAIPVPTLTKGTVAPGLWGTQMKVAYERGAGVSNTVAQVVSVEGHR